MTSADRSVFGQGELEVEVREVRLGRDAQELVPVASASSARAIAIRGALISALVDKSTKLERTTCASEERREPDAEHSELQGASLSASSLQ